MIRGLLFIGALALTACSEASSRGPHRLDLQSGDEARIAEGALPILILKDDKPCSDALFRSELFTDQAGWIVPRSVIESGQRERVLSTEEPGVISADDRGIVWWKPDEENWIWWLRASHGSRVASWPQTRAMLREAQSAARNGYVPIILEVLREQTWNVHLSGIGEVPASEVPLFLGTEEDMRVLMRLEWQSEGTVRGFDPDAGGFIWAGLDREHAIHVPDSLSKRLDFDLAACGSLEVELFDADGAPVLKPRAVFVEEADTELEWSFPGTAPNSPSVSAKDGRAIMHGVPAGKRWRVGACLLPDGTIVATEVAGPTRAGELVRIRLSAAETSVLLTGRLRGPDGLPESKAAWTLAAGSADIRFQTQADGSFQVRVPRIMLDGKQPLMLKSLTAWAEEQRTCALTPEGILASTEGTVWTWSEEPFFAMGRVVDQEGKGVPFIGLTDMDLGMDTDSDASGRFRLKQVEEYSQAWLEIWTYSPWHLDLKAMVQRGQRDVLLTVTTGARISGRLTKAAKFKSWEILRQGYLEPERHSSAFDWSGPQGEFELGPAPVDATEVRIDCGDAGMAVLKDLRLEAGKVFKMPQPVQLDK